MSYGKGIGVDVRGANRPGAAGPHDLPQGVGVEVGVHGGEPWVLNCLVDTGRRPVYDGINDCTVRMLPLGAREVGSMLPDKPVYNTLVIQNLDREGIFAGLVRIMVKLKVVVTHTQETEVIIPDIRHISLSLSQWDAEHRICSRSSLN